MPMMPNRSATPSSLIIDGHEVPLTLRRHACARRYSLRYRPLQHDVLLTLPKRASVKEGVRFALSRERWLLRQMRGNEKGAALEDGAHIPIFGVLHRLRKVEARRGVAFLENHVLHVPGDPASFKRRVEDLLKQELKREITRMVEQKSAQIGKKPRSISLRDTSSRWGSCSAKGDLTFSWRMVFAPHAVLEYLVAHEVAHLREMNHSERFWALVASLCPDYKRLRGWLKEEGQVLYTYR